MDTNKILAVAVVGAGAYFIYKNMSQQGTGSVGKDRQASSRYGQAVGQTGGRASTTKLDMSGGGLPVRETGSSVTEGAMDMAL